MTRMEEIDHLIYGLEVSLVDRKFLGYVQYVQSKQCEEIIDIEMPEVDNPLCISLRKEVLSVIEELRRMDKSLSVFTEDRVSMYRDEVTDILKNSLKVMKELEDNIQKYKSGADKDFPLSGYLLLFKLKLELIKYQKEDFFELFIDQSL